MMARRVLGAVFLACGVAAGVPLAGQNSVAKPAAPQAVPLKVVILGSGGGPNVNLQRFGPSILVETASGDKLLFDCGRGFAQRLTEYGLSLGALDKLFLTHLHSDHILSIPDLFLVGWSSGGRNTPLEVWGPAGTKHMMESMSNTFEFDIRVRAELDDQRTKEGIRATASDIDEGVIYNRNGVRVTAFLVDHGPIKPAFGYRVDFGGRSVAMSGDTRFSENLIKYSEGVDVLIHESGPPLNVPPNLTAGFQQGGRIANIHTPPAETAAVFNRVRPRLAVYAHGGGTLTMAEARKTYSGALEDGEDLMTIDIGDRIEVRRPRK
jgi:ribonuclease Z